jgi:uncharacterized delta-60 repeat protein
VTRPAFAASGGLDPTFGSGGKVLTDLGDNSAGAQIEAVVYDAALQPNGDILVGGEASVPGTTRNEPLITEGALALYNPSGTLDSAFGSGGLVQSTASIGNITNVGIDASGDIFVLPAHAEFSPGGQLDSSVTPAAITASSEGGDNAFLPTGQSVAATAVGNGARDQTDVQVIMFNANGTVDSAFDNPPFTFTGAQFAGHESPGAVAVQPNGQIVIAGSHFEGTSVFGLARLDANGSLDSGFGNAGVLTTSFQGGDGATAVLIQPNGDIVAIGFSEDNTTGVTDIALARYLG